MEHLLAELSGDLRVPGHERGEDRTGITWYREGAGSSKITLHGDGSVGDLELNRLPFSLVQEVCALIARHERSGERAA